MVFWGWLPFVGDGMLQDAAKAQWFGLWGHLEGCTPLRVSSVSARELACSQLCFLCTPSPFLLSISPSGQCCQWTQEFPAIEQSPFLHNPPALTPTPSGPGFSHHIGMDPFPTVWAHSDQGWLQELLWLQSKPRAQPRVPPSTAQPPALPTHQYGNVQPWYSQSNLQAYSLPIL